MKITFLLLVFVAALASCRSPSTAIDLTYEAENGRTVEASYQSDKDIDAPTFRLVRDEQGRISEVELGAGSSLGSPVLEQQVEQLAIIAPIIGQVTLSTIETLIRMGLLAAPPGGVP